jgi:hypothetical protein
MVIFFRVHPRSRSRMRLSSLFSGLSWFPKLCPRNATSLWTLSWCIICNCRQSLRTMRLVCSQRVLTVKACIPAVVSHDFVLAEIAVVVHHPSNGRCFDFPTHAIIDGFANQKSNHYQPPSQRESTPSCRSNFASTCSSHFPTRQRRSFMR